MIKNINEVSDLNQPIIDIVGIQINFENEYIILFGLIYKYKSAKPFISSHAASIAFNEIKIQYQSFKNNITDFIESEQLDSENDPDLARLANIAKDYLKTIANLLE